MEQIRNTIRKIRTDEAITKRLYAITFAAALFLLVIAIKGPEEQGKLITDSKGNVKEIHRYSVNRSERYDVTLLIGEGRQMIEKDVTVTLRAIEEQRISHSDEGESSREALIDGEVDRMLTELEFAEGETIRLPSRLSDGTAVIWRAGKQKDRTGIILIPFIYLSLAAAVIKSGLDASSDEEGTARKEIMKGLPRFCNQLFLMMNAGMILSDAFATICESYMAYGKEKMSVFERELTEIYLENKDHRTGTAALLSDYAARHNVKEMIRIATILTENERRGSDVIESLSRESKYLWDDRKIVARESGKMIDTKLSWPLGLLLILLIVITMAPALLSM